MDRIAMTKQKDQPIKPGWKPSGDVQDLSELETLLDAVTFDGAVKGRMIPVTDAQIVTGAAMEYWQMDRVPSYKQSYTMACAAYWRLFSKS